LNCSFAWATNAAASNPSGSRRANAADGTGVAAITGSTRASRARTGAGCVS
jgi:hypothetical protein